MHRIHQNGRDGWMKRKPRQRIYSAHVIWRIYSSKIQLGMITLKGYLMNSSSKHPLQQASPNMRSSTIKERSLTNTASFLKDITDDISIKSTKSPQLQSPLRQVFTSECASSPFIEDCHPTTG